MSRLAAVYGDGDIRSMKRGDIVRMTEKLASGPEGARSLLKLTQQLVKLAIDLGWRDDNPVRDISRPRIKTDGRHCWTEAEIAAYRKRWDVGTRQRLALELLLQTGQRKGDVVRLSREHVKGGRLKLTQEKTHVCVDAAIKPELLKIIAATVTGVQTLLVSTKGTPYGTKAFCGVFRAWCDEAGLPPECSAHGLRKAFARRMAEAGATAHEIMAAGP
ncbi:tyrosine-type recombinase/integrase [Rhodomicrobium vannielii]|nr:tyrosine-type recombinase/integrase [Rhodomicrobium vannielii]